MVERRRDMRINELAAEQRRIKLGFAALVLGLLLVFWAWGSYLFRASTAARAQAIARVQVATNDGTLEGANPTDRAKIARALWLFLVFGLLVVFLILFGTYAIIRAGRRYRAQIERDRPPATNADDAWEMHTVPQSDLIGEDGDDEDRREA